MNILSYFINGAPQKLILYKKELFFEKLEVFIEKEKKYKRNQEYIFNSTISSNFSQYYSIFTYLYRYFENINYITHCEQEWKEIAQLYEDIKLKEPLFNVPKMKEEKPIYEKVSGYALVHFVWNLFIIQIGYMLYSLVSSISNTFTYNNRHTNFYLYKRAIIVGMMIYILFMLYYCTWWIIKNVVMLLVNLIIIILFGLIDIIKIIFVIALYIIKFIYTLSILVFDLIKFFAKYISKICMVIYLNIGNISNLSDIRFIMNNVSLSMYADMDMDFNFDSMNMFDIDSINTVFGTVNTGMVDMSSSILILLNNIKVALLGVPANIKSNNIFNSIDVKVSGIINKCNKTSILENYLIEQNKKKKAYEKTRSEDTKEDTLLPEIIRDNKFMKCLIK